MTHALLLSRHRLCLQHGVFEKRKRTPFSRIFIFGYALSVSSNMCLSSEKMQSCFSSLPLLSMSAAVSCLLYRHHHSRVYISLSVMMIFFSLIKKVCVWRNPPKKSSLLCSFVLLLKSQCPLQILQTKRHFPLFSAVRTPHSTHR